MGGSAEVVMHGCGCEEGKSSRREEWRWFWVALLGELGQAAAQEALGDVDHINNSGST